MSASRPEVTRPERICSGCGHPKGHHKRGWGPCQHTERRFFWAAPGEVGTEVDGCGCRRMDGAS